MGQGDQKEGAKSHAGNSDSAGKTSFPFEPVSKDSRIGDDGNAGAACCHENTIKEVELEQVPHCRAEKQSDNEKDDSRNNDPARAKAVDETPYDRCDEGVGEHGHGLNAGRLAAGPMELLQEHYVEYRKTGADSEPEGHGHEAETDDDPTVIKPRNLSVYFRVTQ